MRYSSKGEPLLVSACLLGVPCRYDGRSKAHSAVCSLVEEFVLIPVCPEQLGGLPTPRPRAVRKGSGVYCADGTDVTPAFTRGAAICVQLAELFGVTRAVLKEGSPSCGSSWIYDGSFSRKRISGEGVTAEYLRKEGLMIYAETDLSDL